MKKIKLTGKYAVGKDRFALVDDDDFERISKFKWCLIVYGKTKRVGRSFSIGGGKTNSQPLSRFIMNPPKDKQVDHKNHNVLDNRKQNLRICTVQENNRNRRGAGASGFRGVSWEDDRKKWRVYLYPKGRKFKRLTIGRYKDFKEAIRAYNTAARKFFGEYAVKQ